ncbi:hypothetical protein H17ap60334_05854 [Thermosipho africanus H17ap60334]|jgi:hypothetical protein|uniref:hypothetical protein n=1 Tax=Thermosipho TaxID=2420 RepID=UPI00028BFD7D|nr:MULTISPECIES: hypothetical protein [Thermosipho]EKF49283.1 hypothetical protein H17ap60334_05854 [Thermosipho africanus H17ap60334]MBZ4650164.1 hypothetical protein [Thermosipho sp. (in: thermotogales)]MDK2839034.1 hypothetical protein [Thermosipho sp. (in: thermotogales)]
MFNFIENIAGKRDFFIYGTLHFDVYDQNNKNLQSDITLDATIVNLEHFYLQIYKPEFLKDIQIEFNSLTKTTYYKYSNYKVVDVSAIDLDYIYEILKTIFSFLSSSLFTIYEDQENLTLIPAGAPFLKRLGLEPTKISVYFDKDSLKKIMFTTDDSTENITITFDKFQILNLENQR